MASPAKLQRIAISNILLGTDFSSESRNAFQCAVLLARRYGGCLFLTHILPPPGSIGAGETWPAVADAMRFSAERGMAELEKKEELHGVRYEEIVRPGDVWNTIAELIADKHIDLIVMGTHGDGGIRKLFLGSTAEKVTRHATCPVLTVGPHVELASLHRFSRILYATDFSCGSLKALTYALSLAEEDRADLTLLHVIESQSVSEAELLEWKRQDRERLLRMIPTDSDLAYQPEIEVEIGIPEVEIVRLADTRKAELIVMGSHSGGAASTHLPWTTLHQVLRNAHCPVLTVRGD